MSGTGEIGADTEDARRDARVDRWFSRGRCLVHDDRGESYLVDRVVPGEQVLVDRFGRKNDVVKVVRASKERRRPRCENFDRCTGCALLHVSRREERRYKTTMVAEVVTRFTPRAVRSDEIEWIGTSARQHVRSRCGLRVERRARGEVALGLGGRRGGVADTSGCIVLEPTVEEAAQWCRRVLRRLAPHIVDAIRSVDVLGTSEPAEPIVRWCLHARLSAAEKEAVTTAIGGADTPKGKTYRVAVVDRPPDGPELGDAYRSVAIRGVPAWATPRTWTHATPAVAERLYAWAIAAVEHEGAAVLDGTCGIGGLSFALGERAESVLGVDADYEAVQCARRTAAELGLTKLSFRAGLLGTITRSLRAERARFEVAAINPMRAPVGEEAMRDLPRLGVRRLVYLAPAPQAGCRDLAVAMEEGFELVRIAACDLHPGTGQVMGCFVLERSP